MPAPAACKACAVEPRPAAVVDGQDREVVEQAACAVEPRPAAVVGLVVTTLRPSLSAQPSLDVPACPRHRRTSAERITRATRSATHATPATAT